MHIITIFVDFEELVLDSATESMLLHLKLLLFTDFSSYDPDLLWAVINALYFILFFSYLSFGFLPI